MVIIVVDFPEFHEYNGATIYTDEAILHTSRMLEITIRKCIRQNTE